MMKKVLRKIIVNDVLYFWRFKDEYINGKESHYKSQLMFFLSYDRNCVVYINFKGVLNGFYGNPLSVGTMVKKDNNEEIINLNKPKYIAEIIKYLLETRIDFNNQKRYVFNDGNEIVNNLGYEF